MKMKLLLINIYQMNLTKSETSKTKPELKLEKIKKNTYISLL